MIVTRPLAAALVACACFMATTAAQGAVRYAAPGGGSSGCTALAPCDVGTAINGAASGDEVVLAAGTYTGFPPLAGTGKALNIHGVPGQPRPLLAAAAGTLTVGPGSTIRRIEISASGPTVGALITVVGAGAGDVSQAGVIVDDVVLRSPGALIDIGNAGAGNRIRGSVLIGDGSGVAVSVHDTIQTTIEHVTLLARGADATALRVEATNTAMRVAVVNSIVRGTLNDVAASRDPALTTFSVTMENSAYRTSRVGSLVTNGANNVGADPLFADADAGDVHQAPGSPTLDAGTATAVTTDIDGQPRAIGPQPDIGADEAPARATLASDPATEVTPTSARLHGMVVPNGLATTFRFDFGPTASYGASITEAPVGADARPHAVQTAVTGLAPNTTYHYRVVATNALGPSFGDDVTFTTSAAPPDTIAPTLGPVTLTPGIVRRGKPAVLRFRLSEAATVTVTIERIGTGRKRGSRCDATAATGPRCTTFTRRATERRALAAGSPARFAIPARPGGKPLPAGAYRLSVQATDAAKNLSRVRRVTLTVR